MMRDPSEAARNDLPAAPGRFNATSGLAAAALAAALLAVAPSAARAAPGADPDWPCIQRKVPTLFIGQMWAGPVIDESLGDWRDDAEVNTLAHAVSLRRMAIEEAEERIAGFAERAGDDRNRRLSLLFAGAFELINRERSQIISGIARYANKQTGLSEKIDAAQRALREARAAETPDMDRIEALEDAAVWDARIYEERAQSLTYVCETPVILEKRAFALGHAIMRHLDD